MHSHRASVEAQQQDGVVVAHDGNEDSTGNDKNNTINRQHKRKMMYSFGLLCFFMITIFQVGNMTVTTSVRTEMPQAWIFPLRYCTKRSLPLFLSIYFFVLYSLTPWLQMQIGYESIY